MNLPWADNDEHDNEAWRSKRAITTNRADMTDRTRAKRVKTTTTISTNTTKRFKSHCASERGNPKKGEEDDNGKGR